MHVGSFLYKAQGQLALEGFDTELKDTAEQIITDIRVRTRSPLVEGWSFHSLHHSANLNSINRETFKKDFVVGFVYVHVGLMCMCAEILTSPLFIFLHVCSTCSSHISANIYTGCKTLLISLPCLLSCSFSGPTLTLNFFHPDWEWQEGGDKESGGQKKSKWVQSEVRGKRGSEEKAFGGEREKPVVREEWAGKREESVQRDGWLVIL